jgi:GT2 family glycosyltransferase
MAALEAIARQRFALDTVEVLVIADGCRDDTVAAVRAYPAPYALDVAELPGVGPSGARNRGAELARAPLLLFLDDDVEPLETWLAAHVEAHERNPHSVVIGSYAPVPVKGGEFRLMTRDWWNAHFEELERPGHRMTFRDVLTGNLSITRSLWREIGGLDETIARAHEDWELGIRLIKQAIPIIHAPAAFAWHHEHETLTLQGAFKRAREEGIAGVRLAAKHPQLRAELPIVHLWSTRGWKGHLFRSVFRSTRFGEAATKLASWIPKHLADRRSGKLFRASYGFARRMHYLRGATAELHTLENWRRLAAERVDQPGRMIVLDLEQGIQAAEQRLDAERPDSVSVVYGKYEIGSLPQALGAEPWQGRHLRPYLTGEFTDKMLQAMQKSGRLLPPDVRGKPNPAAEYHFGQRGFFAASREAYDQWARSGL